MQRVRLMGRRKEKDEEQRQEKRRVEHRKAKQNTHTHSEKKGGKGSMCRRIKETNNRRKTSGNRNGAD